MVSILRLCLLPGPEARSSLHLWKEYALFYLQNGPIGFTPSEPEPFKEEEKVEQNTQPQVEPKKQHDEDAPPPEFNIELLKADEKRLLDEKSKPIRQYLIDNVIPHLTEGLIEVCRTMPKEPLDFLVGSSH